MLAFSASWKNDPVPNQSRVPPFGTFFLFCILSYRKFAREGCLFCFDSPCCDWLPRGQGSLGNSGGRARAAPLCYGRPVPFLEGKRKKEREIINEWSWRRLWGQWAAFSGWQRGLGSKCQVPTVLRGGAPRRGCYVTRLQQQVSSLLELARSQKTAAAVEPLLAPRRSGAATAKLQEGVFSHFEGNGWVGCPGLKMRSQKEAFSLLFQC